MTDRCPIEPGTRVRIVSGPFAHHNEAIVARVTPIRLGASRGPGWHLTCTTAIGYVLPLLLDEVQPAEDEQ